MDAIKPRLQGEAQELLRLGEYHCTLMPSSGPLFCFRRPHICKTRFQLAGRFASCEVGGSGLKELADLPTVSLYHITGILVQQIEAPAKRAIVQGDPQRAN